MSDKFSASLKTNLSAAFGRVIGYNTAQLATSINRITKLVQGTGAGKGQVKVKHTYTIPAGQSVEVDLSAGIIDDGNGLAVSMTNGKVLFVEATSAEAESFLEIGGATEDAWYGFVKTYADVVLVMAGGCFHWENTIAGSAIVEGSADRLKIKNPGAYEVICNFFMAGEGTAVEPI